MESDPIPEPPPAPEPGPLVPLSFDALADAARDPAALPETYWRSRICPSGAAECDVDTPATAWASWSWGREKPEWLVDTDGPQIDGLGVTVRAEQMVDEPAARAEFETSSAEASLLFVPSVDVAPVPTGETSYLAGFRGTGSVGDLDLPGWTVYSGTSRIVIVNPEGLASPEYDVSHVFAVTGPFLVHCSSWNAPEDAIGDTICEDAIREIVAAAATPVATG